MIKNTYYKNFFISQSLLKINEYSCKTNEKKKHSSQFNPSKQSHTELRSNLIKQIKEIPSS